MSLRDPLPPLATPLTEISPHEAGMALADFLRDHGPVTVLTGAGISTDSGIPDYRDGDGAWKRKQPVQHQDFMTSAATRQRYWARSLVGWSMMQQARPNTAHAALTRLQQAGLVGELVTQNVDRLHQKAGTSRVIDLHGRADEVICMSCGHRTERDAVHRQCNDLNPGFRDRFMAAAQVAPDGDADLEVDFSRFTVADCTRCGGIVKPDVVFFGDNVPKGRVEHVRSAVVKSSGLLVIGSSLMVYSGFRFCRYASVEGRSIALLTLGRTRADELASLKLNASISETLTVTLTDLALN